MKLGLAVSTADALPSAFVVFRDDLCRAVDRAAALGYHGVELALLDAAQVDVSRLKQRLRATGLEVPCISSGQVFAADRLYFTHPDAEVRKKAVSRINGMICLAAQFGAKVNTGRVRGLIHEGEDAETAGARYIDCLNACAETAEPLGVELIVEPVNRYEVNFINNCVEAIEIIERCARRCVRLMPDVFHMNIEDASFRESFEAGARHISYVHLADSNRLAPGWGHLDFDELFSIFDHIGYDGWVTAEILPKPDPESAAAQAARFLLPRIEEYSRRLATAQ